MGGGGSGSSSYDENDDYGHKSGSGSRLGQGLEAESGSEMVDGDETLLMASTSLSAEGVNRPLSAPVQGLGQRGSTTRR